MANLNWLGGAAPVAQVSTYVFANTWEADDVIRAVVGQKKIDVTTGSTVIATFLATFVTAWNNLSSTTFPEFGEVTASSNGTTLTLTADTAGKPFTATLSPLESDLSASGAGTIEGGTSATAGTTATAATGPNHFSEARNWSTGDVPSTNDSIYFAANGIDCLYGLTPTTLTLTLMSVEKSYTGKIGLAEWAGTYPEYRTKDLTLSSIGTLNIGHGVGTGSQRIRINGGAGAGIVNVFDSSTSEVSTQEAIVYQTTGAGTINVTKGNVGIGIRPGELANNSILRVGYRTSVQGDASVRCGAGTTLSTVEQSGGALEVNTSVPTLTKTDGNLTIVGSGTIGPSWVSTGGAIIYRSTGTLSPGTLGSTLDFRQDMQDRTVQTLTLAKGAEVYDQAKSVTWSGPLTMSQGVGLEDVKLHIGKKPSVTIV
jgi:hypothetical protein